MRVAIDYLLASTHPPGVGRYTRELVRALVRVDERPELALLEFGRETPLYGLPELGIAFGDARTKRFAKRWPRAAFEWSARFGRGADVLAGSVDLVHQVRLPALPVTNAAESIALAELPDVGTAREAELRRLLARGTTVFVFARDFERRLRERFEPARVRRVSVGCEHWRRALSTLPEADRPARILVLGRAGSERGLSATLRAFELLRQRGVEAELRLASAPPNRSSTNDSATDPAVAQFAAQLERSSARASVRWELPAGAGVTDATRHEAALPELVARSSVLLHLVAEPGTAVTPLEACALGVPVVASRWPAFEEALGSVIELVDHAATLRSPELLADAVERAIRLRGDSIHQDRLQLAARPFTWDACARGTLGGWREAVAAGIAGGQSLRPV